MSVGPLTMNAFRFWTHLLYYSGTFGKRNRRPQPLWMCLVYFWSLKGLLGETFRYQFPFPICWRTNDGYISQTTTRLLSWHFIMSSKNDSSSGKDGGGGGDKEKSIFQRKMEIRAVKKKLLSFEKIGCKCVHKPYEHTGVVCDRDDCDVFQWRCVICNCRHSPCKHQWGYWADFTAELSKKFTTRYEGHLAKWNHKARKSILDKGYEKKKNNNRAILQENEKNNTQEKELKCLVTASALLAQGDLH